jgi:branched-chain amino acid transport system permease protein
MPAMPFAQLLVNALVVASQYALMASGFALIYRVSGVFHFAHGISFILAPYVLFLSGGARLTEFIALALLAVFACGLFGALLEGFVYYPLRKRNTAPAGFLIASLAVYITCQNLLSLSLGDETQRIGFAGFRNPVDVFGARLTAGQIAGFAIALAVLVGLSNTLWLTRLGKKWRAIACDSEFAEIVGINARHSILLCFFLGSCLAGLSGLCVGLDVDINPTRGMQALIMAFLVYVIAGEVLVRGIVAASCLLSLAQTFGGWYVGTRWQMAISFLILVTFLFLRPQGMFGKKTRSVAA